MINPLAIRADIALDGAGSLGVRISVQLFAAPRIPWFHEACSPDAFPGKPGGLLCLHVEPRITPVGQRPAFRDQPGVQVDPAGMTHADDPPVAVAVHLCACDIARADLVGEGKRGPLCASLAFSVGDAVLPTFQRVDAEQAYGLTADLDRVAVDDRGPADDVSRRFREDGPELRGRLLGHDKAIRPWPGIRMLFTVLALGDEQGSDRPDQCADDERYQ